MKKIIPLLVLLLATLEFVSSQQIKTEYYYYGGPKLSERQVNLQGLTHGYFKKWDRYGVLIELYNYVNGKKHGKCVDYHTINAWNEYSMESVHCDGKPLKIRYYNMDVPIGTHLYYQCSKDRLSTILERKIVYTTATDYADTFYDLETGKPSKEVIRNGNQESTTEYYINGQKKSVSTRVLHQGLPSTYLGKAEFWYENGNQKKVILYNESGIQVGEIKEYHENGQIATDGKIVEGNFIGKKFFDDGIIEMTCLGNVVEGNFSGELIQYYPNENKKIYKEFENGKQKGFFIEYYENGNKKREENEKDKIFRTYYENGNVEKETFPDSIDNWLTIVYIYYDNGNIKSSGFVDFNNRKWKDWYFYHDNGKLHCHAVYKDDNLEPQFIEYYDKEGKLNSAEQIHLNGIRDKFTPEEYSHKKKSENEAEFLVKYNKTYKIFKEKYVKACMMYIEPTEGNKVWMEKCIYEKDHTWCTAFFNKINKKRLFNSYLEIYLYIKKENEKETINEKRYNKINVLIELTEKIILLYDQETKDLEKALKNADNIDKKIDLILGKVGID